MNKLAFCLRRSHAAPLIFNCIDAMLSLGEQLQKMDVAKGYLQVAGKRSSFGGDQELEFRPRQWLSGVKEVELSFLPDGSATRMAGTISTTGTR